MPNFTDQLENLYAQTIELNRNISTANSENSSSNRERGNHLLNYLSRVRVELSLLTEDWPLR